FIRGDDAEEIAFAHHPGDAGDFLDRAFVHLFDLGAWARRPHHAAVQHARHMEILHIGEAAGDLLGNVDARRRFADDLVVFRRFFLYRLFRIKLDREALVADQLSVADLFLAPRPDSDSGYS